MGIFKAIRDKLASIDEVVPVLVFFEIIYLAIGQLIIWAFLPVDKPYVALGFAIGVGFAILSSIQNSMILGRALSKGKKRSASAGMVIFMLIRIAGISLVVVLALLYKFCSPVAVLVGVLAIQAGVYFEPAVRRRRERKQAQMRSVKGGVGSASTQDVPRRDIETQETFREDTEMQEFPRDDILEEVSHKENDREYAEELQENLQKDAQGTEGDRSE